MRNLVLFCLLFGCNSPSPSDDSPDLGVADLSATDKGVAGQATVVPCCGGAAPMCTPAPDGGCQPPMQLCSFAGSGCYLPCTPAASFSIDVPSGCGANLCKCLLDNGQPDPCEHAGGVCDPNLGNPPPGEIDCACF